NPTIDSRIIEEAKRADMSAGLAEYECVFRSDLSNFITWETLQKITMQGIAEKLPEPGLQYSAFIDPSGGQSDSFCCAIATKRPGNRGQEAMYELVCLREIESPFSPESACKEISSVLKSYRCTECVSDRYSSAWVSESMGRMGILVKPSSLTKSQLYLNFL